MYLARLFQPQDPEGGRSAADSDQEDAFPKPELCAASPRHDRQTDHEQRDEHPD